MLGMPITSDYTMSLNRFIGIINIAKKDPKAILFNGLYVNFPETGEDIRNEFRRRLHERINAGVNIMGVK
jgi:hypothetical protein